jgi:hypothetical protein
MTGKRGEMCRLRFSLALVAIIIFSGNAVGADAIEVPETPYGSPLPVTIPVSPEIRENAPPHADQVMRKTQERILETSEKTDLQVPQEAFGPSGPDQKTDALPQKVPVEP